MVLGHARRNRNVTQVPLHPHSFVVVSSWRSGQCDIFVLHIPRRDNAILISKQNSLFFNYFTREKVFLDCLKRQFLAHLPTRAGEFRQQTRGRKSLRWQRACCRFTSRKHPLGQASRNRRGGNKELNEETRSHFKEDRRLATSLKGVWSGFLIILWTTWTEN